MLPECGRCSAAPRSVTYLLTQLTWPRLDILQLGTPVQWHVLCQQTDDRQMIWEKNLSSVFGFEAGEERVVSLVPVTCLVLSRRSCKWWPSGVWGAGVHLSGLCSTLLFVAYFLLQNKTSHLFWYLSNLSIHLQYCCFLRETVETLVVKT